MLRSSKNKILYFLLRVCVGVVVFVGSASLLPKKALNLTKKLYSGRFLFLKLFKNSFDGLSSPSPKIVFPAHYINLTRARATFGKRRGKDDIRKPLKDLSWFLLGSGTTVIFFVIPFYLYLWYKELPKPTLLAQSITKCTKILDRKERLLYQICPEKRSEPVGLAEIPKSLVDATLAIEDSNFYSHNGFKISSILRALKETIVNHNLQGGSTITQQLVKISLLSPERTLSRKFNELFLAVLVENEFTKNQILEMYFNNVPYTGNVVGVEEASQKLFGKTVSEIDLAEASILAGLPSAPSLYSPARSLDLAKQRQKEVLNRMVHLKKINREEADKAFAEPLSLVSQNDYIRAPHFVDYIRAELNEKYGERYVNFGGLTIVTTLDLDIEDASQAIVKDEIGKLSRLNVTNGAAVVLSTQSGEVLAMVGSKDYFSDAIDGKVNVTVASRQPGSAIKPVTYALALMNGYKASSVIDDSPISIRLGNQTYTPINYDGAFHGKVTLRTALANSYNIPAVKVLMSLHLDDMVKLGRDMGLRLWKPDGNYGPSLTLGGKETTLLDLTNVYATLGRQGIYTPVKAVLRIKDSKGNDIYSYDRSEERVLPAEVAYILTSILSDWRARIPAFGVNNFLTIAKHTVAVKTGTTNEKRDNYTEGYTPSYTVGVWVGNNDNTPMNRALASGITGAAPIWNRIMSSLIVAKPDEPFVVPDGVVVKIFPECGYVREVYIKGTAPSKFGCESDKDKKDSEKNKDKKNKKD